MPAVPEQLLPWCKNDAGGHAKMRIIIKWFARLALFPVILVLTFLEWAGSYFTNCTGIFCKMAAGIVFLLTVTAWVIGITSAEQATKTLIAGCVLYLIPLTGKSVIMCVARVNATLTEIIQ